MLSRSIGEQSGINRAAPPSSLFLELKNYKKVKFKVIFKPPARKVYHLLEEVEFAICFFHLYTALLY